MCGGGAPAEKLMAGVSDDAPPMEADIGACAPAALANDGAGPAFCAPVATALVIRSEVEEDVAALGMMSTAPDAAPVEPAAPAVGGVA
jgi:hypothetical protein